MVVPALTDQHDRSSQRIAVTDALEQTVEEPAIVFLPPLYGPYLQNPFSFLRNDALLEGDVIYALDGVANDRLSAAYAGRTAYRLVLPEGWSDEPGFEPVVEVETLGPPR